MIKDSHGKRNGQAGSSPKERRSATRHPFAAAAYAVDVQSDARVISRVSNLSMGGCHIDALTPFPTGTVVWLRVTKADQSLTTKAKVVAGQNEMGMSLAFFSTEPEQLWVAKNWIDKLGQNECPAPGSVAQECNAIESAFDREPTEILKYLILMLVQKAVLNEAEGSVLLQKLLSAS